MKKLLLVILFLLFPSLAHAQLTGYFMGTTVDKVGGWTFKAEPDGFPDWQIHLRGLKAQPTAVIVSADEGREWRSPLDANMGYWLVGTEYDLPDADLYISIAGSVPAPGFNVQVRYPDDSLEEINVSSAIVVTPASKLEWDQDAPSLFDAQHLAARVYLDGSMGSVTIPSTAIICTGDVPTFICNTPFPGGLPLTAGVHSLFITVIANGTSVESAHSNTISFTVAVIITPRNLRLR